MLHLPDKARALLGEVGRVLGRPGVYLQVSDEPPELRLDALHKLLAGLGSGRGEGSNGPTVGYRELYGDGDDEKPYFLYTIKFGHERR